MINFDELELGKDYLFMDKKYLYETHYWKTVKIVRKGKSIPVNRCGELLDDKPYDYIAYLDKDGDMFTVSKYKDGHLDYYYLTPFENPNEILSQFTEIVDTYKQNELEKINTRLNEEKISLEDDLNKKIQKFQENLLNQFKEKESIKPKKKDKKGLNK